jgi:hypothetical protein
MPVTVAFRSGNSSLSCFSGVSTTGQSSMHSIATIVMRSSAKRTTSVAPGNEMRRSTILPTSTSGEMVTSIGRFSRENRSEYSGAK